MKQAIYLLLLAPVLLTGCGGAFKKSEKGTQYKIISKGSGEKLQYDNFFEFSFEYRYKDSKTDSFLTSSQMSNNGMAKLDTINTPAYIYKIFVQCRKGDSVVLKVPVDSAFAGGQMPEGFRKGGYFFSTYRILNIYKDQATADSVFANLRKEGQQREVVRQKELKEKDDKTIEAYLKKNNITAAKAPAGTYVQVIAPGTGPKIDTTNEVMVNYTGRTMDGKVFDSNTDTAFHHVEPYPVRMWAPNVVQGWYDGLGMLEKGAKAKFYIPSGLAYGPQGNNGIKPNEILMFDIEVVEVFTKAQAMDRQKQLQQKMMEMQKRYTDSMNRVSKAAAKDTAKKTK
jgi:FKBP-type peptidyl-prolyl cis-trans isomerase FkpA